MSEQENYALPNGREIMRKRLLQERKDELKKVLKDGKKYKVQIVLEFDGEFETFEEINGDTYAVFKQGMTDRGNPAYRKIKVQQITNTALIKENDEF